MSEILARLRIRETHGIRRFLYPLYALVTLPDGTDWPQLCLSGSDGTPVPLQVSELGDKVRLDFAVSLAPFADMELRLVTQGTRGAVSDPLQVISTEDDCSFQSTQQLLQVSVGPDALLHQVVYDGTSHLRGPVQVEPHSPGTAVFAEVEGGPLTASASLLSKAEEQSVYVSSALTACKSWVTVTQTLSQVKSGDKVIFTLPLAVTSPTLTCDFGVGGGTYGKLQQGTADEVVWLSEFTTEGPVRWFISTDGRIDYTGIVPSRAEYLGQQWLHVIDSDKALAVAITHVPKKCMTMTVTLNAAGDVKIVFEMAYTAGGQAEFGVCYHFLNDVPAVAAATNPQSILLPPVVEVLMG